MWKVGLRPGRPPGGGKRKLGRREGCWARGLAPASISRGAARDGLGKGRGWKSPSISAAGKRRGSPSARELMKTAALFF